jgi:HSP20 family molecular chaperone IbpA
MDEILDIIFPIMINGDMMYMEELNDRYVYYKGIPGLSKDDLDIRLYTEKDFVSIKVKGLKKSRFVEDLNLNIVRLADEVAKDKTPEVIVDRGILEIKIFKANPTEEKIL